MCSYNFDEILVKCKSVYCIKITKCDDSESYCYEIVGEPEIQCAKSNKYESYSFPLVEVDDLKETLYNCWSKHGENATIGDQHAKIYCYALLQKN